MDDKQRMYYWRNQKMKIEEIMDLLKKIKKEMNIQPAEKVINNDNVFNINCRLWKKGNN